MKVSTTSTPLVPTTNPALLPALLPSGLIAAYTPSPIFLTVKSGVSAAKAKEEKRHTERTSEIVLVPIAGDGTTLTAIRKHSPLVPGSHQVRQRTHSCPSKP